MYVHNVKYLDFNGQERDEDLYFHLSLPEVTRIEAEASARYGDGDNIKEIIESLVADGKTKELLDFLETLVLNSYGNKTSDGKSFSKSEEVRDHFANSLAYAEFFEDLLTKEGLAQEFGEKVADNGQKRNQVTPKVVESGSTFSDRERE